VAAALAKEAKLSLRNTSGLLTFSEFLACYEHLERWLAHEAREGRILAHSSLPRVPPGWAGNATLRKAFAAFCRFGVDRCQRAAPGAAALVMTSQQWAKLCCDSGLLEPEGPLPMFAVDVIFAMCKPPKQRRLTYGAFLQALACVARETGTTFAEVAAKMGCRNDTGGHGGHADVLQTVLSADPEVRSPQKWCQRLP
jgi:p25-alpha